jgi:hypothetical protein
MNLPDNQTDQQLGLRAHRLYQEAARHIDPTTAGRLRAARRRALDAAQAPPRHLGRWLVPTGALAAVALTALMIWQPLPHTRQNQVTAAAGLSAPTTDLDNVLPPDADKVDPTLYQHLDFYGWLAANSPPATQTR